VERQILSFENLAVSERKKVINVWTKIRFYETIRCLFVLISITTSTIHIRQLLKLNLITELRMMHPPGLRILLRRRVTLPVCSKIGLFVFKISCSQV